MMAVNSELKVKRFAVVNIPTPPGIESSLPRLLDTEQTIFVIARARGNEKSQHWLYLGLISQSTQGNWIGICGLFIPGCGECDDAGLSKARLLQKNLTKHGWNSNPISRLPAGIRPQQNWFENRMIAVISQGPLRSRWMELPSRADRFTQLHSGLAIVKIGAGLTTYRSFVSTENLRKDAKLLHQISLHQSVKTPNRSRATYRLMPQNLSHDWVPLSDITAISLKPGSGKTGQIPAHAGALLDGQEIRVTINLRALAIRRGISQAKYVALPVQRRVLPVSALSLAESYLKATQAQSFESKAAIPHGRESSSPKNSRRIS
jgi:hypothetical protein